MKIEEVKFIGSSVTISGCPPPKMPEFALIGRSNVGKSSLINMLMKRKGLAKISATPGKTQTINHFLVNNAWYLVDLPGYGYAKASKTLKYGWGKMIEEYVTKRENLYCLIVLIDSRLEPQAIDVDFINWAGKIGVPLCLVLTKSDKLSKNKLIQNSAKIQNKLLETWQELPPLLYSSASTGLGREEIFEFLETALTKQN
jgi:GTP-binding protein